MPESLKRQIGPFKVWQWLLIVIAGIGIGLLVRSQLRGGDSAARAGPTTPAAGDDAGRLPATQGAPTILQQDFQSVLDVQKEQDRFQDELDARDDARMAREDARDDARMARESAQADRLAGFFTDIRERITAVNIPSDPAPLPRVSQPEPTQQPASDPLATFRRNVINAYHTEGVKPPGTTTVNRIAREVQQGRSLQDLRGSIRNNERNQGRNSASESREYWTSKGYQF